MKQYTREELIAILDKAVVPQDKWRNRDSSDAQRQAGQALFLLKAGCDFQILTGGGPAYNRHLITDEDTIWVEITFRGFDYFEQGGLDEETFYIPTLERLEKDNGGDWY